MSSWRLPILAFLLLALGAGFAVADETSSVPPSVAGMVERLGTPAQPEALERLLEELRPVGAEAGLRLARALGRSGGHVATGGLLELLAHDDTRVRETALRAAAHVGLRTEHLRTLTRRCLETRVDAERRAAIAALGRIGDARDVPDLLDLIESEDLEPADRTAAYEALATLGAVSIPATPARWRAWWSKTSVRDRADLYACLTALENLDPEEEEEPVVLREVVARHGWLDVSRVRDHVSEWLVNRRPELRREACHAVSALRLADCQSEVRWARQFDALGIYGAAADEALRVLGSVPPN